MAEFTEFEMYNGEVKVKFYPNSHMYKITDEKNGLKDKRVKGVTTYLGIKDKSNALVSWATETAGLHLYDILEKGETITMPDVFEAINKHREIKDDAAEIGKKMHEWCEYFIKHKLKIEGHEQIPELPEDKQILLGVNSFLEWYTAHNIKFIASERIVYSRKNQYIGTMDFMAEVDGKLTGGDFKSSNGLYNTVLAQISAYIAAYEEEMEYIGEPVSFENRVAVRLSKETESQYIERMERKGIIKQKTSEYEPYKPFEWKIFEGRDLHHRDYNGFIHCKNLFDWDNETDFYKNK